MRNQSSTKNKTSLFGCGTVVLIISIVLWSIAFWDGSIGLGSAITFSIITVIGIVLVVMGKRKSSMIIESKHDKEKREADIEKILNELKSGDISKIKVTGMHSNVIMKKNEKIIFMLPKIDLIEHVSVEQIKGGTGISVMGYGLTGGVHSELKEEQRVLDNGVLVITNERLIFDGERRSSETIHSDILAIEQYSNGIAVKSRAREVVQYYVITKPEICVLTFDYEEHTYKEEISGKWLAAIAEGAIRSREKNLEEKEKQQ